MFTFKFEQNENGSFVVSVFQESRRSVHQQDDVGALYYVVAVILIYGCSILMMIASYIRKNKVDRRLNRYLKEMANVRKRERRMTLMSTAAKSKRPATTGGPDGGGAGAGGAGGMKDISRSQSPSPSFNLTPSGRGKTILGRGRTIIGRGRTISGRGRTITGRGRTMVGIVGGFGFNP